MTTQLDVQGRRTIAYLTNKSGGAVANGDVVIVDASNDEAFTTTTTAGLITSGIGVVIEANGIANNGAGRVVIEGYVSLINVNAGVTRGHFGKTFTVAKQASDAGASRVAGVFCQFLTGGATPTAVLFGMPDGSTGSAGSPGTPANTWGVAANVGAAATLVATDARLVGDYTICQGRLTLTTAVPVTTADVTAATTLYFTPFRGALIGTYNGTDWNVATFAEKSITLASLTASLPYDVFIVNGTLALELVAWTNVTTRATALVLQDGVLCKSGALTRRYLGTICITATTGQCEDSVAHRLVWNYYNRLIRPLKVFDSTDQWSYAVATWRAANGTTTNHRLDYVQGVSEDVVRCNVGANALTTGAVAGAVGIGIDSTSVNSADIFSEMVNLPTALMRAEYRGWPGIGYHTLTWLEYTRAGTVSFQGDGGVVDQQSGIVAEVWG